eukprot:CAMPEP_0184327932 /NCGR_PEP_ID=MMETSP1049-20130417/143354_1 /TAXON_ID=77928 /ORGANISM="Proteomonas sulcata, Strain CCMP704" /LENGTH=47 /DNA_ID= /DNA_START= /DNA_END= /DNA_ORIENTATION=
MNTKPEHKNQGKCPNPQLLQTTGMCDKPAGAESSEGEGEDYVDPMMG